MPPYAKREPKRREFHGDVFEDDYEWMRDKDSDDVRSYVAAENQYCERRMAHLADFRHTLFEELKSHVEETDMSVPTRVNDYWYFTRTQQGKQYGVQCRIPVRDADDWESLSEAGPRRAWIRKARPAPCPVNRSFLMRTRNPRGMTSSGSAAWI